MSNKIASLFLAVAVSAFANAETVVVVSGQGADKTMVSIDVGGASAAAFTSTLRKNLELSGCFAVGSSGAIRVTGSVGTTISAAGKGKSISADAQVTDDKSVRMLARRFSDAMCEAYAKQKGFACDKVIFLNRGKQTAKGEALPGELCMCYPDGQDIRQLTKDNAAAIYPRWKDDSTVFYIGYLNGAPKILELDVNTGKRNPKWNFRGTPTGIAVSPDGSKVAAILSFQGNPELYVIDGSGWTRLTNTKNASEGQPSWSPDGKSIVYVSDESRHPQLYVIDVATKASRRLTSKGSQNVDPDWGRDGRITYITKRGGLSQVAVIEPSEGESSVKLVTSPGSWEHPSWARDMRHVAAGRDGALFVVDTIDGGDDPKQMFRNNGNWISPSWSK